MHPTGVYVRVSVYTKGRGAGGGVCRRARTYESITKSSASRDSVRDLIRTYSGASIHIYSVYMRVWVRGVFRREWTIRALSQRRR